jgi:hypothetical protein
VRRALLLSLVLVGCRERAQPAVVSPPPVPSATIDSGPSLAARLRVHAVTDRDFARRVFYTWTTPKQIEALRASKKLLVATAYQGFGPSRFILDLEGLVHKRAPGFETARTILMHPQLARRRYAWPSPFATRRGLALRGYGDALIRVVLKPGAHLARFDPGAPWVIVDTDGKRVDALDPSKLAAVFHVRYAQTATAPFREYVLCNEDQVESWSVGTEDIKTELAAEKTLLADLAKESIVMTPAWPEVTTDSLGALWHASLAFDNERYTATPENMVATAKSLEAYDPTPPAFAGP